MLDELGLVVEGDLGPFDVGLLGEVVGVLEGCQG